jgi:hypothetical protein
MQLTCPRKVRGQSTQGAWTCKLHMYGLTEIYFFDMSAFDSKKAIVESNFSSKQFLVENDYSSK